MISQKERFQAVIDITVAMLTRGTGVAPDVAATQAMATVKKIIDELTVPFQFPIPPLNRDLELDLEHIPTIADTEQALIIATLKATGGNKKQAAIHLGIGERTMYRKLQALGEQTD